MNEKKRISLFRRRRAETWAAAAESSKCHGNAVEERREFGRVVKLDRNKTTTLKTLQTAKIEGVGEYVMCKEGDVWSLSFDDNYFDVVVLGVFVHMVGKEYGKRKVEVAIERTRVVGEVVRVLKPGGVGVVWDLRLHVPEYMRRLQELKMEDIRVSKRVTAFMVSSHIVSFQKPS